MDIRDQKRFYVGDWLVTPDEDTVSRDSHTERLEPLAMQVLVYLAARAGEVVPRSDLEEAVWKGGVVSYDSVTSTVIKLRKALGDSARNSIYIVTVPKRGYQLIAPVRAVHENPQPHSPVAPSGRESRRWSTGRKPVLAVLAVAILGGAVVAFLGPQAPGPAPTGMNLASTEANSSPSIVVLPFSNLSGDPEQAYFVDGVTEDIVTEISRLSNLHVIAWRTSSAYKNASSQPHEIGEELGVGYVLDGSVRMSGDRLRVSARLIDATTGDHLWAERFDRSLVDIFDVQEDVARRIVDALAVKLTVAEAKTIGTRGTDNFAAYEAFLRGHQLIQQRTKEGYEQARKAYEKAIAFDPYYARPYGALAILLTRNFRNDWTNLTVEEARARALELAKKAVALDPMSPQAHWAMGFVRLFRGEHEEAAAAAQHAIALAPNYADGYGLLAFIRNFQGRAEEAIRHIRKAMALNPNATYEYPWNLGRAYYTLGRYEEAIVALEQASEKNPNAIFPRLVLAASYGRVGRDDDAHWEIEQISVLNPNISISKLATTFPIQDPDQMDAFLADLRDAGLQE